MEIVVTGRHVEVSESFRSHVEEKLARLEKHDHRIIRVQVEVSEEKNPRQADRCMKVQLTAFSKGPVVRAEACADHKMGALDVALDRMAAQMRRAADRRRIHRGRHVPTSVAQALAGTGVVEERTADGPGDAPADGAPQRRQVGGIEVEGDGPLVVREKVHPAEPMTLDQALYEMELVGHDFYLFVDKANDRPSVVYRRRGYDYGVIALDLDGGLDGVGGVAGEVDREVAGAGAAVLAGRAEG